MRARPVVSVLLGAIVLCGSAERPGPAAQARPRHNVVIVVMDGLRAEAVNSTDAPAMTALRSRGVYFANRHAVFPTFTTPNAAACRDASFNLLFNENYGPDEVRDITDAIAKVERFYCKKT